jgi:hypothetical protein
MPDEINGLMKNFADGIAGVVIAVRSRKYDNTKFHRAAAPVGASIITVEGQMRKPCFESGSIALEFQRWDCRKRFACGAC